ncbi:replication protein C, IncQ-type [Paenirhodobacter populi]|uniref:replication protein C, IncQ-type n=1 Tax=Paenirhodobacter populi TaxID=2306993 RepID=UPI000FE36FFA|nr:replication protein C, IncQ-type [Sinirhodobacter populi]RWR05099.1 replication protein C [Sinirhodobacter populi]
MGNNLTHARIDRAHALAQGLFRSLGPGDRKRLKLDIAYDYGDGEKLEFWGKEPLGAFDMRVFQGLIAMAGPDGRILENSKTADSIGQKLLTLLFDPADEETRMSVMKPQSVEIRDSLRRLAREIGAGDGGKDIKRIRESIERLFGVTVMIRIGRKSYGSRLLSFYASDEESGALRVSLNPRLAHVIMGGGQYARIDLVEARSLESDPARLIHQRISAFIDPGASREVSIERLSEYVWPDAADTPRTARSRLTKVRKAVEEIRDLALWNIKETGVDKWRFIRPRLLESK